MNANGAWLEFSADERLFLGDLCTIGRGPSCQVVIASERVSRRHAVIKRAAGGGYEVMDMGSSNGTFLNGQRITAPAALRDGWIIEVGLKKMTFRTPPASVAPDSLAELAPVASWLLTIDAVGLGARESSDDAFGKTFEAWGERCRRILTRHRGSVSRAGGDGWLVHWPEESGADLAAQVVTAIEALRAAQRSDEQFRFSLHYGEIVLRPSPAGGMAPSGSEVIYALQLQRLVRTCATSILISEAAAARLDGAAPLRRLNAQALHEYRGSDKFFTLASEAEPLQ